MNSNLYYWKSIRTISLVETIIIADYDATKNQLTVHSEEHTEPQIQRLKNGLSELEENHEGLKYYILLDKRLFDN